MAVGRKRTHNKHLPRGVTHEHGAYFFRGPDRKRVRLGAALGESLAKWVSLVEPEPGSIRTMHDAFERYKLEVLPKRAAKTQRGQFYIFPKIDAVFGKTAPRSIRPRHGYELLDRMSKTPTAALKAFNLVSAVLTQCVKWGVIDENPFWQVDKEGYIPASRDRCPTDDEFDAVYELANDRMQIAMDIAVLTGLRRAGVLALKLDSDTDAGLLAVNPGKKTKALLFVWTPELRAVIDRAKRLEPRVRSALLCAGRGKHAGKAYTDDGFSAIWQRLMNKATKEMPVPGIPGVNKAAIAQRFTFNDIRAKSATDTETEVEASARLGHTTLATTRRIYIRKPNKVRPLR
jgi:integrase